MKNAGIHVYDGFPWYINIAHTDEDLKYILDTVKAHLKRLQGLGIIPTINSLEDNAIDTAIDSALNTQVPSVLGAKLMLDENGDLNWFQEDRDGNMTKLKMEQ